MLLRRKAHVPQFQHKNVWVWLLGHDVGNGRATDNKKINLNSDSLIYFLFIGILFIQLNYHLPREGYYTPEYLVHLPILVWYNCYLFGWYLVVCTPTAVYCLIWFVVSTPAALYLTFLIPSNLSDHPNCSFHRWAGTLVHLIICFTWLFSWFVRFHHEVPVSQVQASYAVREGK